MRALGMEKIWRHDHRPDLCFFLLLADTSSLNLLTHNTSRENGHGKLCSRRWKLDEILSGP